MKTGAVEFHNGLCGGAMAGVIAVYILFGLLPLGLAVYLLATAKRRVGHYVIAVILLLIATLLFFGSIDSRHAIYPNPYPR